MTSSTSCSGSGVGAAVALALAAAALQGCAHSTPPEREIAWAPGRRPAIAVFPVQNLSGGRAPTKPITDALRQRLEAIGVAVAPANAVDRVLADRRIRHTGGLDRDGAAALREALRVDGVLLSSVD